MRSGSRSAGILLVVFAILIVAARYSSREEPQERDITTYAVIGEGLIEGRELYSDLWDHKPPGIHVTYALAHLVTRALDTDRPEETLFFLLNVVGGLLIFLGIVAATSAMGGGLRAGALAGGIWAIVSGDLRTQANQPNTELFINAGVVIAFALLLRVTTDRRWRALVPAALCFACASLVKPVAAVVAGLVAIAHIARPAVAANGRRDHRRAFIDAAVIAGIGAVAWATVAGYFAATGRFAAFRDAVFTYNRAYASDPIGSVIGALHPLKLVGGLGGVVPLLVLIPIGLLVARPQLGRSLVLLLAYALGTHVAVAMPGHFWPHYYQLWLPWLAIAGAHTAHLIAVRFPGKKWLFAEGIGTALLVTLAAYQLPAYLLDDDERSVTKYGDLYVRSRDAGRAIDQLLGNDATFYEWGSETGLYYYSGRRPPTGVFYDLPLRDGPLSEELGARVIADLEKSRPALLIYPSDLPPSSDHAVGRYLHEHYRATDPPLIRHGFTVETRSD